MRARHIAGLLVRCYPAAWRREYGAELNDILVSRRLTPRVIADVVWNGLRQRVRAATPSTILGMASMLAVLAGFVITPTSYLHDWTAVLRPTGITFPTVTVTFLASEFYVVLLVGCGCWTQLRRGGPLSRAALAAMRMTLIAGIPVMLAGLLIALGLADLSFLNPGATDATALIHPSALSMIAAPLARAGESWIWGLVGGLLGRRLSRPNQRATAS